MNLFLCKGRAGSVETGPRWWQSGQMTTDERDRLSAFALRVWGYKQGEVVSLMIHLGDRLGLYGAMAGQGPMTAAGLAAATGLQERWLLEWLRGQAAAGLIGTEDGEAFEISAEAVAVLADNRGSLWFAAGALLAAPYRRRWWRGWPTPFVPGSG